MQPESKHITQLLKELVADTQMARYLRSMAGGEFPSVYIADNTSRAEMAIPEGHPIMHDGRHIGSVRGGENSALVASFLGFLASKISESEDLRQRLEVMQEEVTRFYDLSSKASRAASPSEVCKIVVDEARRLFKADDISISLRMGDADAPICYEHEEGETPPDPGENTLSTMMSELMSIQGKVLGVINVASANPGAFSHADMRLLKALAAQAAAPIESAQHQHRLKNILATIERLNRYEDLETILDAILYESRRLANADAGTIFLVEDGHLKFSYVHNDTLFRQDEANAEIYGSFTLPINENSIVGYAALTGTSVVIDDAYNLPSDAPYTFNSSFDEDRGYRTTSILTIPLKTHHGHLVGVMQIINAKTKQGQVAPFSKESQAYLPLYANNAAGALERAMMTRERVLRMMKLAEMRDPHETGAHVQRVGAYSAEIYTQWARNRKLDHKEVKGYRDLIRLAAMLHDVGKVGISDAILKKPGKLTPEEFSIMKWHPVYGAQLFHGAAPELDRMCHDICLGHHERWDGAGYPGNIPNIAAKELEMGKGYREGSIPLSARITALADVYDALSSRRCYKDPWPKEKVFAIIEEERGKQFDPELVDAFFQITPLFEAIRERYQDVHPE